MKRFSTLLFLFLTTAIAANAQFNQQLRHHVIVAIDMTMPGQSWQERDNTFNTVFNSLLKDTILREGDLLSIVGFSTDEHAANLDDYTYVLHNRYLGNLGQMNYTPTLLNNLKNHWSEIASQNNRRHWGNKPFSMISLAKMYAFEPVRHRSSSDYVNRTFLVFISDQKYNGGDFYQEAVSLYEHNYRLTPGMMQDYGQRVASQYFVRHLRGYTPGYYQHIDLFEYIPLQEGLTLSTVLDFHSDGIEAKRTKGGRYRLDLNAASRKDPRYSVMQIRYRIMDKDGQLMLDTICCAKKDSTDYIAIDSFNIVRDLGIRGKASSVKIDAWVALHDGIYNATVLTPVDGAPKYLASEGLSVTVPITYEKKAPIVFGIARLPGILQFSDNQDTSAALVNMFLALVFLALLVLLVRRIRIYHPTSKDIEINLNK